MGGICLKGLFGTLLTYLINNEMESEFEWELVTDKIYRDEVCFQVGPYYTVTTRFLPTHLEITCTESNPDLPRINCTEESICREVHQSVEKGIKTVTSAINYINAQHSFTFYCISESCSKELSHPAKLKKLKRKLCSLKCDKLSKCFSLPSEYEKWQLDSLPHLSKPTKIYQVPHSIQSLTQDFGNSILLNCMSEHASKWAEIGICLRFHNNELSNIAAKPILYLEGPKGFLREMLSEWLEWAPGDQRGSNQCATLEVLKIAVSKAGLGVTAANIQKVSLMEEHSITDTYHDMGSSDLTVKEFDFLGLEHNISGYDITIRIPESTIPTEEMSHLKISTALNGPFKSSGGKHPISPWLCPGGEFILSKPMEIVLPHIAIHRCNFGR